MSAAELPAIQIMLNGEKLATDTPPEVVNDRTMLPVRAVAEAFGAQVDWQAETAMVVIHRPDAQIVLRLGSTTVHINYLPSSIDVAPYILNDRTMVPVRFVAEAFAAEVQWSAPTRTVSLIDRSTLTPEEPGPNPPQEPGANPPAAFRLTDVTHRISNDIEIVEIRGSSLGTPNSFTLASPARIVLDFEGGSLDRAPGAIINIPPGFAIVREVRIGEPKPGVVRVVVELDRGAFWQISTEDSMVTISLSERPIPLVGLHLVIDAGHGGSDPGAIGPTGYREKDVNLAVALLLEAYLTEWGAQVTQTRNGDSTISLDQRADFANLLGVDLFVSIHHNSARDPAMTGTETYYHLSKPETRPLAQLVQQELLQALGGINRGVQTANFSVIRRTQMPAILVEAEFLQNPAMEQRLRTPEYHDQVAAAIARGIAAFWMQVGYLNTGG